MACPSQHDDKAEIYSFSERRVGNGAGAVTASLGGEDIKGYTGHDRRDMRRMGKKQVRARGRPSGTLYWKLTSGQEFRRNFRIISTVGFTTCVMGTWEILLTANTQGLIAGGMSGLFWSLCWCYLGQLFVVLSLAEMASMAPVRKTQHSSTGCWVC